MSVVRGPFGGSDGVSFDDGNNDDVLVVTVAEYTPQIIRFIKFHYAVNGATKTEDYGLPMPKNMDEFRLDSANNEYLKAVEGTHSGGTISSLRFISSTGNTSRIIGRENGQPFRLEEVGMKIVGFLGRASTSSINALGARFAGALVPPTTKLVLDGLLIQGYEPWDHGVHDKVVCIIGKCTTRRGFIFQVTYMNDGSMVTRYAHGKMPGPAVVSGPDSTQFRLRENEYLTSVQGYYQTKPSRFHKFVFKTNIRTSTEFGSYKHTCKRAIPFNLKCEEGRQIVGFFYRNDKLGVYVKPINNLNP